MGRLACQDFRRGLLWEHGLRRLPCLRRGPSAARDIDAVSLGLPDHWHGIVAVMAARTGKDVYGEKPLAHNFAEGRAIRETVKRFGRVWQTGSWQRSKENSREA